MWKTRQISITLPFTIKESQTPLINVKFTMKPASTIYSTAFPFEMGIKRNSNKKIKGSFGHGNVSGAGKKTYYVLGVGSPTSVHTAKEISNQTRKLRNLLYS